MVNNLPGSELELVNPEIVDQISKRDLPIPMPRTAVMLFVCSVGLGAREADVAVGAVAIDLSCLTRWLIAIRCGRARCWRSLMHSHVSVQGDFLVC